MQEKDLCSQGSPLLTLHTNISYFHFFAKLSKLLFMVFFSIFSRNGLILIPKYSKTSNAAVLTSSISVNKSKKISVIYPRQYL